jgi:hypothetical protein
MPTAALTPIVLIAFWVASIRLWVVDGPKIPLVFIALWIIGFLVFPRLSCPGYVFVSYEAVLAAILLVIDRYKSVMS